MNTLQPKTVSWKDREDCCSWEGVVCDNSTGDIVALDLSCAGLQGTINSNSSLFSLHHLRRLNLAGNFFIDSSIPEEIRVFSQMTHLNLSDSGFSGNVPTEISQLSKLVSLDLSSNYFLVMQNPTMRMLVTNLTQLEELHLTSVNMSTVIPSSIMNVSSSLNSLDLSDSSLGGIFPENIFQLPNLRKLDLSDNLGLQGTLPDSNWSHSLYFLSIGGCSFNGEVPHSIATLPRLTYLDLSWNNFTGHVDFQTFSTLENLFSLRLSGLSVLGKDATDASNNFPKLKMLKITKGSMNNFPCFLSSMPELRELYLSESITSEFPGPCINNALSFPQLRTLDMSSCNLTKFPSFLSQSDMLRFLYLSGNMIKGAIPSWFMGIGIDTLEELYLGDNLLQGELHLPWKRLSTLYLSNNSFQGSIPPTLCQLTFLTNIELGQNNLTGVFPSCLGNLTDLQGLDLSMNSLTGPLPPSIGNCTSLEGIDLSYNKLEGPLPLPSSATSFYSVSNNNFSGELSSLICNANGILVIDMSNNGLTGTLPHCFKNITTSLLYFNLRVNKFYGRIPEICPNGNARLISLDFSRNQFEGSLPRSLSNCTRLEVLDVGNNNLVDSFPHWLGHLPLKVLSLRSNKLQGSFSHKTQPFSKLRILDLSNNDFDCNISDNLISKMIGMMRRNDGISTRYMSIYSSSEYYSVMINLKGVEIEMVRINVNFATLDLSSNNFRGEIPENIGWLKALNGLNFSFNGFTGMIPASLGNLMALESLDLSSNELIGRIPDELVRLTYLGALNLSRNNLAGPIPTGGHFNTFLESSFIGNLGLCGIPLRRSCGQRRAETKPQPDQRDYRKNEQGRWFEWRFVMIGLGSGIGIGISLGYMVLETGRPLWLARLVVRSESNCGGRRKRKRRNDRT